MTNTPDGIHLWLTGHVLYADPSQGYADNPADLDFGDGRYSAPGFRGVALWLLGYAVDTITPDPVLLCEDPDCGHDGAECWSWSDEPDYLVSRDQVLAVMVGDDAAHLIDVGDLTAIGECHAYG